MPTIVPSTNTGMTWKVSGKCPEPRNESLSRIESPGFSVSGGKYSSTCLATAGIEPRWPGLKLPCATSRALRSNSAVEKSSPSRTPSEKAVLRKVMPSSSAIDIRAFQITVRVTGSRLPLELMRALP